MRVWAPRAGGAATTIAAGTLVSLVTTLLVAALIAPAAHAGSNDDGGGNVSVTIEGETPSPTPSATGGSSGDTGAGGGAGGQGSGSSGTGAGTGTVSGGSSGGQNTGTTGSGSGSGSTPAGGTSTSGAGEVSLGGVLYLGGLESSAELSPNPLDGRVNLWFTVRNASKQQVDASARFWMTSVFGNTLDSLDVVVPAIKPGEQRVVRATLHNGGQWMLLPAHATLTPPDSVDGVSLAPVTRDATVFLFPWLLVILGLLVVIGWVLRRVLAVGSAADPVAEPALGSAS